jgi:tetratricopeptide (TPR) repeat protein
MDIIKLIALQIRKTWIKASNSTPEQVLDQVVLLSQNAATAYQHGQYEQGIHLAQQACNLAKVYFGKEHPDYGAILNILAELYRVMGCFNEAEPLYLQALEITGAKLGTNHPHYATFLNNLALLYQAIGRFSDAELLYQQAQEIMGAKHPDYASTLSNLASLYYAMGRFQEAEPLYRQDQQIVAAKLGTNHPEYATSLSNLASLYQAMGRFEEAEPLYQQDQQIVAAKLGTDHPDYAQSLNNLAVLYYAMGRFCEAESLFRKAMKIREAKLGTNHPDYAQSLTNLAALYKDMGRFSEAESLYCKAMEIREAKLGTNHPDYAATLNNLAFLYEAMGRFCEAERLYRQNLEIMGAKLSTNHPHYATTLNNLASLYQAMDRFCEAELLYQQAQQLVAAKLGTDHPHYALSLNNLAYLYRTMGRFSEAEPLYRQAQQIVAAKLGKNHPHYAANLHNLSGLQAATDRPYQALPLMQDAAKIQSQILGQIFSISSDNQRLTYLQQTRGEFYAFLSLVAKYLPNAPDAVQASFDLVLRRKALGAEAAAIQRTAILSGRYPHLADQLNDLRQLDNQIASLAWNVPPPEQLTAYQTQLATLYQQRDELDRALSRDIPEMNLQKQLDTANRDAIAKALPDGATLVEFVRFDVFNFKAIRANGDSQWLSARYLAFILPAKEPEQVQMIDLGEAEAIDNLIRVFRKSVSKGDRDLDLDDLDSIPEEPEPIPPDKQLRQKLIDPLKPYLKPQQQVFLAPDGELCCLPFGVLPTAEGRYLMEDYELCYLSVGRDLLRFGATQTLVQPTDSLVIADPDYNLSHSDLTPQLLTQAPASLQGKGEQEQLPSPCRILLANWG